MEAGVEVDLKGGNEPFWTGLCTMVCDGCPVGPSVPAQRELLSYVCKKTVDLAVFLLCGVIKYLSSWNLWKKDTFGRLETHSLRPRVGG